MSYTAKRISKLEKEIGYCELKLEKEGRLRKKIQYFANEIAILQSLLMELMTIEEAQDAKTPEDAKKKFLVLALRDIIETQIMQFLREKEELETILQSYKGYNAKKNSLEFEKKKYLTHLSPRYSRQLQGLNREYRCVELQWSACSEDLANIDNGLFYLERNLDYLRSCHAFLILAHREDLEDYFLRGGNVLNLLKHSNIGRAREMAGGADRNLIYAQSELVCLSQHKVLSEKLKFVLYRLLGTIYTDVLIEGDAAGPLKMIEEALAENLAFTQRLKEIRAQLAEKTGQVEKRRMELFSQLGGDGSNNKGKR